MCYARRQRSSWARIKLSINCIKASRKGWSNLSSLICSFTFVWVVFSFRIARSYSHTIYASLHRPLLRTFSLLFNFQGPNSLREFIKCLRTCTRSAIFHCRFPRQLWYYTTDLSVCQYFFWIFLKKFSFSRFKQQEQNLVSAFVQFEQSLEDWVHPLYNI